MIDSKQRFSSRVENYVKYRPSYPSQIIDILGEECGLTAASVIADVGSGTGIMTRLLLANGNKVFAVEPNAEMRQAAEQASAGDPNFVSIAAAAEETTLDDHSVDFVLAAQAFHWFDRKKARAEFARILKPQGWVVLVWNDRRSGSTPFLVDYEELLKDFATDYPSVNHKNIDAAAIQAFFSPATYKLRLLEYTQQFDFAGVKGRLLSSSYSPEPGAPNYEAMLARLTRIFEAHQVNGQVSMEYDTEIFFGRLQQD